MPAVGAVTSNLIVHRPPPAIVPVVQVPVEGAEEEAPRIPLHHGRESGPNLPQPRAPIGAKLIAEVLPKKNACRQLDARHGLPRQLRPGRDAEERITVGNLAEVLVVFIKKKHVGPNSQLPALPRIGRQGRQEGPIVQLGARN